MNPGCGCAQSSSGMEGYKVRYKHFTFAGQNGKYFDHCLFKGCIAVLEKGDTDASGSSFQNCKLLLKGNAYTVGKIIKLFTGNSPLRVLDLDEPLFEKPRRE